MRNRKPRCFTRLLLVVAGMLAVSLTARPAAAQPAPEALVPTQVDGVALRAVGIPDRRLMRTSAVLLDPEAGLDATVLQATHTLGDGRAVRFHPASGRIDYLTMRGGSGAWSVLPTGDGGAYLGSHLTGHLFRLAPGDTALRRIELPRAHAEQYTWIFSLAETPDGLLYLGTYPEGALLRYDPAAGRFDELGQVTPDTTRAQYVRSLYAAPDGRLYAGMGAHAELVVLDPASGARERLLPAAYRDRSFVYYVDRVGDWLVAGVTPHDALLLFDAETHALDRVIPSPDGQTIWKHNHHSVFLHAGMLYFGTQGEGALWAYDVAQDTTRLVGKGLGGPFGLAQGRYLFLRDYFGTYRAFDLEEGRVVRTWPTRFEGAGMELHALAEGPAASVVGGIYINQGFFRYDPAADTLWAPGAAVSFGGQIDALATHDGLIYLAHYTSARLSVYDPDRPWQPGPEATANPRALGTAGDEQDRFPTAVVGSDGRLYLGTIPKYGKLGGALVVYDPADGSLTTHRHLVRDHALYALVEAGGVLYGGTAVMGGLGATPAPGAAMLVGWDLATQTRRFARPVVPGARALWGLDRLPNGQLIGGADSTLFVYDPSRDAVAALRTGAVPEVITKLVASQDGWIYGLTEERFFRTTPDLLTVQTLDVHPDYWDSLVETRAGRLFVGRGAMLLEVVRSPGNS